MAAGTGIASGITTSYVNHLTGQVSQPAALNSTTIKMRLITTAADATNSVAGTECADTNYTAGGQTVAWGAPAVTAGNGSANGFSQAANTAAATYPAGAGATVFAAAFTIHGYETWGGTSRCMYQNLGSNVVIPIGQQAVAAIGAITAQVG